MDQFVRVKLENGAEGTVTQHLATRHKLEVLDKPATDARGYALPEKPHIKLAPAGTKYDGMKVEDLQTQANDRQITVEGTGKDGNVIKPDLVAALVAADNA